jgi:hypothetical protein
MATMISEKAHDTLRCTSSDNLRQIALSKRQSGDYRVNFFRRDETTQKFTLDGTLWAQRIPAGYLAIAWLMGTLARNSDDIPDWMRDLLWNGWEPEA